MNVGFIRKVGTVFFVCWSVASGAQSAKQYAEKGQEYEQQADYFAASQVYKEAVEKFPDNLQFQWLYAENCRKYNDYANAEKAYKNLVTDDITKKYPLAPFWQAAMTRQNGKYEVAATLFERFKLRYRGEKEFLEKADREIEACKWAQKQPHDSLPKIIHPETPVNSVFSDFNPFTNDSGELLFSSMRDEKNKFLARFFNADSAKNKWLSWNNANPKKHIANGFFNATFDELYFTLCDNNAEKRCEIYVSRLDSVSWSTPVKLDNVNDRNASNTQPALARWNGKEYLLFSSNREGGKGGFDIYRAKRVSKTSFAKPENMSVINTSDNEYTPFFDADSAKLFFASDGWNGFGGLDIFSVSLRNLYAGNVPENAGFGINSEANDFGYTLSPDLSKAYLVSNRKGSFFIKAETCCNDIWYYETGRKKDTTQKPPFYAEISDSLSLDSLGRTTNSPEKTPRNTDSFDLVKNIPIVLYFHNDEPECCNLRDTTNLNYETTYEAYSKLLNEYEHEFAKGLKEGKKTEAEEEVVLLFTGKVERGMQQLRDFSDRLLNVLLARKKVTLVIKGYCSPLNYNQYNIQLGYRRIASVKNYFYHYKNGVFRDFIDNGLLVLDKLSLGEETAPTEVSDKREDPRNSVYNPAAAQERRVEIISVIVE